MAVWTSTGRIVPRTTKWLGRSSSHETALERLGRYGQVPDFALIERSGRPVTRADLSGKVWVANFIYTQCTETCPT